MVLVGGAGAPQGLQVAGHRAGGVDHDVMVAHQLVQGAEHLGLCRQRLVVRRETGVDDLLPLGIQLSGACLVGLIGRPAAEFGSEGNECSPRVGDDHRRGVLGRVERQHVDVDEGHLRVGEDGVAGGGEVGVAGADTDHQVGFTRDRVGGRVAGGAHAADRHAVVEVDRALACLGVGDRDAGGLGEGPELLGRLGVDHAAAGDHQRAPGRLDRRHRTGKGCRLRYRTGHVPDPPGEEGQREVEGLGLDVLGQADGGRAGLCRVGQYPHGAQEGRDQLLGPVDAVPVAGDGLEGVVDRDVQRARVLQLLQHRIRVAGGEDVGGQQQHREPVGGGQRGTGHHVEGARADRGGHSPGLQPVLRLGVGGGSVDGALLVAHQHIGQVGGICEAVEGLHLRLQQGLADAGDVAVAEDAEDTREELLLGPVPFGVLVGKELHHRLRDGEPNGLDHLWLRVRFRLPGRVRGQAGIRMSRTIWSSSSSAPRNWRNVLRVAPNPANSAGVIPSTL